MKAGVLGVVDGTFTAVDSHGETVTEGDRELARRLEITRVFSLPGGEMAFEGRAAAETLAERTTATIDGGEIRVADGAETATKYAEFVGVPGEFVAVDGGGGTFAFDLVGAETGTDVSRATFDLDSFYAAHEGATPWKAGFYGTAEDALNGVFHGSDLRRNDTVERLLADGNLNQVGLTYEYDGTDLKVTASRSGYVEVYRPSEFDSAQYLEYLLDEVYPHLR